MPTESHDESYEADDESSEADDEAVNVRANLRIGMASPAAFRQRVLSTQRVMAAQAVADRKQLDQRIRKIRVARPPEAKGLAPVAGSGVVSVELPNGRRTQMRITPAPASANAVNRLRHQIIADDRRQAQAATAHAKAIRELTNTQAAAFKKLTEQQAKSDQALTKRVVEGDGRLDQRISKGLTDQQAAVDKQRRILQRAMRRSQQRTLWNSVLLASGLPFFRAYGDETDPFSHDNLVLTGSLAGWLTADEIIDGLMGRGRKPGSLWRRGTSLLSYLAPVGNALTAHFLLDDRQHVRFLTGTTTIRVRAVSVAVPASGAGAAPAPGPGVAVLDLPPPNDLAPQPAGGGETSPGATGSTESTITSIEYAQGSNTVVLRVAKDYTEDFASLADRREIKAVASLMNVVPGGEEQASLVGAVRGVTASVGKQGSDVVLTLRLVVDLANVTVLEDPSVFASVQVGWMVDTQAPDA